MNVQLFSADGSPRTRSNENECLSEVIDAVAVHQRSTTVAHAASVQLADIRPAKGGPWITAYIK